MNNKNNNFNETHDIISAKQIMLFVVKNVAL